jgi:hypothetical protein
MKGLCFVASALFFSSLGCQPVVVTTPPTEAKNVDIHIKTPRANIDVEKKKDGDTTVEVNKNK